MAEKTTPVAAGCAIFLGVSALVGVIAVATRSETPSPGPAERARAAEAPRSAVKPLNVVVKNSYAESIFILEVTATGKPVDGGTAPMGKKVKVLDHERIAGHGRAERGSIFTMPRTAELKFNLSVMSLGEWRSFSGKLEADPDASTLSVDYDWDIATAAFTMRYGWR